MSVMCLDDPEPNFWKDTPLYSRIGIVIRANNWIAYAKNLDADISSIYLVVISASVHVPKSAYDLSP